jgi:hypothetical protein
VRELLSRWREERVAWLRPGGLLMTRTALFHRDSSPRQDAGPAAVLGPTLRLGGSGVAEEARAGGHLGIFGSMGPFVDWVGHRAVREKGLRPLLRPFSEWRRPGRGRPYPKRRRRGAGRTAGPGAMAVLRYNGQRHRCPRPAREGSATGLWSGVATGDLARLLRGHTAGCSRQAERWRRGRTPLGRTEDRLLQPVGLQPALVEHRTSGGSGGDRTGGRP